MMCITLVHRYQQRCVVIFAISLIFCHLIVVTIVVHVITLLLFIQNWHQCMTVLRNYDSNLLKYQFTINDVVLATSAANAVILLGYHKRLVFRE